MKQILFLLAAVLLLGDVYKRQMYNYVNRPWRTQELVDSVLHNQYFLSLIHI